MFCWSKENWLKPTCCQWSSRLGLAVKKPVSWMSCSSLKMSTLGRISIAKPGLGSARYYKVNVNPAKTKRGRGEEWSASKNTAAPAQLPPNNNNNKTRTNKIKLQNKTASALSRHFHSLWHKNNIVDVRWRADPDPAALGKTAAAGKHRYWPENLQLRASVQLRGAKSEQRHEKLQEAVEDAGRDECSWSGLRIGTRRGG